MLWVSYFILLSISFFIFKMGMGVGVVNTICFKELL